MRSISGQWTVCRTRSTWAWQNNGAAALTASRIFMVNSGCDMARASQRLVQDLDLVAVLSNQVALDLWQEPHGQRKVFTIQV